MEIAQKGWGKNPGKGSSVKFKRTSIVLPIDLSQIRSTLKPADGAKKTTDLMLFDEKSIDLYAHSISEGALP